MQQQMVPNVELLQLNGNGFDFDLLTFQLANRNNMSHVNMSPAALSGGSAGGGGVVVNQLNQKFPHSWSYNHNNVHNLGNGVDFGAPSAAPPPQQWRNYGGDNARDGGGSPNGTVPRHSTTNASVSNCGGNNNNNNNGLCSQIDKILEHNLQPSEM